jgi:manganese/iron transport system ATP-binding protein/manganese/zinc/iron transport system ATP- binding protein
VARADGAARAAGRGGDPGFAGGGGVAMSAAATRPLLAADGVDAGYDGAPVLREVTFAARPGDRIAVLGPNGGGKTTLFRVLSGELPPMAGTLALPARCAIVPQTERSRLDFPVSAVDVALMGAVARLPWWRRPGRAERRRARAALQRVGLGGLEDRTFGDLSGGQRQRVLVARALMQDAPVLLLDEPFTGLDAASAELLEGLLGDLAAGGRALLIATHDVEQAQAWDRVLCLNGRQIAFGEPGETLSLRTLELTYGGEIVALNDVGDRCVVPPHHHGHDHDHEHARG